MRIIFKANSTLILIQLTDMKEGNLEAQRTLPMVQRVEPSKTVSVGPSYC